MNRGAGWESPDTPGLAGSCSGKGPNGPCAPNSPVLPRDNTAGGRFVVPAAVAAETAL